MLRDLNLPKSKAELLGSRSRQWNMFDDVNITDQRTRHQTFSTFFTKEDGSKNLVFPVFLANGFCSSLPIAHSVNQ